MNIALDMASIYKIIVNDDTLKSLMNIPTAERSNYGILLDKYFLQTYVSDKFTNDGICRILLRSGVQTETNNEYVKWNPIIIEVFVPKSKDLQSGFQSKSLQITDRLYSLLNRQYVNSFKMIFVGCYELISNTVNYRRMAIKFDYKQIYS